MPRRAAVACRKRMNECIVKRDKKPCIDIFQRIPLEVVEAILSYIRYIDIASVRATCRLFRMALQNSAVICRIFDKPLGIACLMDRLYAEIALFPNTRHASMLQQLAIRDKPSQLQEFLHRRAILAAEKGFVHDIELILARGIPVSGYLGDNKNNMMTTACVAGHANVVKLLLARGAPITFPEESHRPDVIIVATCAGHVPVMKVLLEHGADVNAVAWDYDHRGLLELYAMRHNHASGLQLLCKYGADVNVSRPSHCNALMGASMHDHEIAIAWLLDNGARIDGRHSLSGKTALMMAAESGACHSLMELLQHGADTKFVDCLRKTALMYAVESLHVVTISIVMALCMADKDTVNASDVAGMTPLHVAARSLRPDLVRVLLQFGARMDVINQHGHTPLYLAAFNCQISVATLLLSRGANPRSISKKCEPPLLAAVRNAQFKMVELFLAHGASATERSPRLPRQTPLLIAAEHRDKDVAELLMRHGACADECDANKTTCVMHAIRARKPLTAIYLIEHIKFVDAVDASGMTALMHAAILDEGLVAHALLARGADIHAVSRGGDTAMTLAEKHHSREIVEMLRCASAKK